MTHPTTEPDQTIRERLAPLACRTYFEDVPGWTHEYDNDPGTWESIVDAILAELQEPSEGMVNAAGQACCEWFEDNQRRPTYEEDAETAWQAIIQHIIDGGK